MLFHNRRYLLAALIVVVLGSVIGWTLRDWAPLASWQQAGAGTGAPLSRELAADASPNSLATMPITPGEWEWQGGSKTSAAQFADALVTVTCDRPGRAVSIAIRGDVPDGAPVTVLTTSQSRVFQGRNAAGQIVVRLAADDTLLDAIALSRGRFGIAAQGIDPVYPGSWAEVSRVVEDCRDPAGR